MAGQSKEEEHSGTDVSWTSSLGCSGIHRRTEITLLHRNLQLRQKTGLFPSPSEIKLSCSCPDWADMCKHVAAVLYGIGARLDQQPELLFRLNHVDENELIAKAGDSLALTTKGPAAAKVLVDGEDLSKLFGLDMQMDVAAGTELAGNLPKRKPKGTKLVAARAVAPRPAKQGGSKVRKGNPP